jgi:hypothetical protein
MAKQIITIDGDTLNKNGTVIPFEQLLNFYSQGIGKPSRTEFPEGVYEMRIVSVNTSPDKPKYAEVVIDYTLTNIKI